jgi:hypothetical protein
MLIYGDYRLLLDTVREGVQVTVLTREGWICSVTEATAKEAVMRAIETAESTPAIEN